MKAIQSPTVHARSPHGKLSNLLLAIGLALTLIVSLGSPMLAHEGHHGEPDSQHEQPTGDMRPQTRLEFMQQGLPAAEQQGVGAPYRPAGTIRGLAIGGTASHQRSLVVRSAPSGPDVATTSSDWQQIPDLSASIDTPSNARLAIALSAEARTTPNGRMFVRVLVDGQPANPSDVVFAAGDSTGARSFSFIAANLSGGTHKIVLEWRVDAGHTAYLGDRSMAISASPDSPERGALAVIAAPSGPEVTTAQQTWQPVPQLATSIATAAGADLAITLSGEAQTSDNGRMFVRAVVDGQEADPSNVIFALGSFRGTRSFTFTVADLAAGDHNVQIEWLVDEGATGYLGDRTLVVAASPPSTARNALAIKTAPSGPPVTSTSTGWQPIPDLQTTIQTPAHSDLAISIAAEAHSSGNGRMFVRALVDGRPADPTDAVLSRGGYNETESFTFVFEDLPAGNHTVELQWHVDAGQTGYLGDRSLVVLAGQRERQHLWSPLGELRTNVAPAVEGLERVEEPEANRTGAIYVVAVTTGGQVQFSTTSTPTVFSNWLPVGSELVANPDTAPVLIRNADELLLFVRGADNNLYESRTKLGEPWTDWMQLTTDGSVQGPISVALSPALFGNIRAHVLYRGAENTLHHRSFVSGFQDGTGYVWGNALQGQLGSNGGDTVMAAILTDERRSEIYKLTPPATGSWQHQMTVTPSGPEGGIYDLSNVVFFADEFHVGMAVKEQADDVSASYRHVVTHLRLPVDDFKRGSARVISRYTPTGDRHTLTELILYRNKLLAAFTTPDGQVRQARWDTADPDLIWVGEGIVDAGHTSSGRPNLGLFNMRAFHPWDSAEYGISNYGHDVIAVMTDSATSGINLVNFTRAIFLRDFNAQLALYHGTTDQTVADPSPILVPDPSQDGRPYMSELGYALWTLPYWLADGTYGAKARLACIDQSDSSGRFEPPCDQIKYPVIIRPWGGVFIGSGIWHNQHNNYLTFWEELGHTTAGTMGLADAGQGDPPAQLNADLVNGIPLDALKEAYDLFGERTGQGKAPGRYVGFTGHADNYDAGSRQHSFIYVVYYYVSDGDRLRNWIADDLEAGDDLLQRKYDWVKAYIYRGLEFEVENEPRTE